MQKVLTAKEMGDVDRLTTERYGIPSIVLMENAAHATATIIGEKLGGSVEGKSFLILCGPGNNGGDGAALARILFQQGGKVRAVLFGKVNNAKRDAFINFQAADRLSGEAAISSGFSFEEISKDFLGPTAGYDFEQYDVLVDALFGTGLTRTLESTFKKAVDLVSAKTKALRVSVDMPSGLDADKPHPIGSNASSDLTVSFTAPKLANVFPPASNFNGELHIVNIGSPQELIDASPSRTYVAERDDVSDWLNKTKFSNDSYKNKRGSALLVVGSQKYSGAAVLAGNGAMQSGVGMTTVATPESAAGPVAERILAEVIVHPLPETKDGILSTEAFEKIDELSKNADVVAIGSGLGSADENTGDLVRHVVDGRKTPLVIDADGINALSPFDLNGSEETPIVLTPHEGEFLRLLGTDDRTTIEDRIQAVREFARKHEVILVLKGERTLIAEPGGKVVINPTGNSGLGKAGNGDNLTGILTGFIAQGERFKMDVFESVVAAVYIAGLAGDIAESKFGKRTMLASDVRECLLDAFREVEQKNE